jgi:hypothetical protein
VIVGQGRTYQGEAGGQGGEGEIREDGGEDAQEEGRETEEEREAEQVDQLMSGCMMIEQGFLRLSACAVSVSTAAGL